jgi:catechol 2,3-dioxygenase-like lactoylglutathione lyase family enzyme
MSDIVDLLLAPRLRRRFDADLSKLVPPDWIRNRLAATAFISHRKATALSSSRRSMTMELHRGRLIDHVQLVVKDLPASRRFYESIFAVLNVPIGGSAGDFFWADEFCVSSVDSKEAQGKLTGRTHIAFQAKDRAMVDAFYQAGLTSGGKDNGAPGERPYHPGYYAAFLLDPDGNNIEAVYHGEAKRSASSVRISF